MAIDLDVVTRLDDMSVRRTSQEAERHFEQTSIRVRDSFDRNINDGFGRVSVGAQRSAGEVRTAYEQSFDRITDSANRMHLAIGNGGSADHFRSMRYEMDAAATSASGLLVGVTELGSAFTSIGRAGGPIVIATLAVGLTELAGVAATATQSLWLLPGAIGAIGSAFATVKLATSGLDDAFSSLGDPEKFTEAMRKLSPAAQQFMLSIQGMMPALDQLKSATQDAFFSGMGPQLTRLADQFLPAIQQMTTGVAGAFNQVFAGVADQLMTPQTQSAIQSFLTNVVSTFQQLAPAAAPFTQAMADIMAVGSGVMPELAAAATRAAESFSQFISEASASGDLERWLTEGLNALIQIGQIAWNVGEAFMALAPVGQELLPQMVSMFDNMATIMPVVVETAGFLADTIRLMSGDTTVLGDIFTQVGEWGVSTFNSVRDALDRMFDPIREGIELFNKIPGLADIPQIPSFASGPSGAPTISRGAVDGVHGTDGLPTAGLPGAAPAPSPFWGSPASQTGWGSADPMTTFNRTRQELADQAARGSGGRGGATYSGPMPSQYEQGMVPNSVMLMQALETMFPGVKIGADTGRQDQYDEHGRGVALDIMVGDNRLLGEQINRWLLQNSDAFGLNYTLWQQRQWDPSGTITPMTDRGSPTQNHMDHVHTNVSAGQQASGNYMPLGAHPYQAGLAGRREVTVSEFGTSARGDLQSVGGDIGAKLDEDLGFSKGLPGLMENLTRFLANLGAAPVLGALGAIRDAAGDEGSGLFGMAAANGAFGPQYTRGGGSGGGFGGGGGFGFSGMPAGPTPSAMGPAGLQPPWSADWNAIAQKESSGNWGINTGNGYSGGLQFSPSSWEAAGGTKYAPSAHLATPYQQAMTAEQLLQMQGPGAWPNTFVPGSSGPSAGGGGGIPGALAGLPASLGGGGSRLPGAGMPQGNPFAGAMPNAANIGGRSVPGGPGGPGNVGLGGAPMQALQTAASGLDMLAPGAGAAANIGIQLINRTIGWGAQAVGIGWGGLLQSILPNGSSLGDPSKSWVGRILGGIAGARPQIPNVAGQAAPPQPGGSSAKDKAAQAGLGGGGPMVEIKEMHNHGADGQGVAQDIARNASAGYAAAAPRVGR